MPKDQNITRKLKAILSADVKGYGVRYSYFDTEAECGFIVELIEGALPQ